MSNNELNAFLSSFERPLNIEQDAWNQIIAQARNVWHSYLKGEDWNEQLDINCKASYLMLVSKEGKLIVQNESLLNYVKNQEVTAWRKHLEDRAYAAIKNKRFNDAERYFTKALKLDGKHALNHYRRGLVRMRLLKNKEAMEDFTSAIEANPNVPAFYLKRAQIYRLLDLDYKAMSDMNKSIKLDPNNPEAFEVRGKFRMSLGDRAGGKRDLLQADQLKSEHRTAGKELYGRQAA
jgi:tetratricopeptide (TPR) repeat protein